MVNIVHTHRNTLKIYSFLIPSFLNSLPNSVQNTPYLLFSSLSGVVLYHLSLSSVVLYQSIIFLFLQYIVITVVSVQNHFRLFGIPWTVAHQASLSMRFPRQEYWSGLHFLLQGMFLTQGSNPHLLPWQVDSLPLSDLVSPAFNS